MLVYCQLNQDFMTTLTLKCILKNIYKLVYLLLNVLNLLFVYILGLFVAAFLNDNQLTGHLRISLSIQLSCQYVSCA